MGGGEAKPMARGGVLASDHSKRGRRYVSLVDPETFVVTILEPWEHAALVLCDGTRTASEIADLLATDDESIELEDVERCLKYFERQALIDEIGLRVSDDAPPGPRTLAEIQLAYNEWHREPIKTGQFPDWLAPSFPGLASPLQTGLDPTMAFEKMGGGQRTAVGSTIVLADAESVLIDSQPGTPIGSDNGTGESTDSQMRAVLARLEIGEDEISEEDSDLLDVLSAVDQAVSEADALDARGEIVEPPLSRLQEMLRNASVNADIALNPTMVGVPAESAGRITRVIDHGEHSEAQETIAAVPVFEEKTTRTRYPRDATPVDAIRPPIADAPAPTYRPHDDTHTELGVMVHAPEERSRTVSTGAAVDVSLRRERFDRLISTGGAADRRAGARNAATIDDVVGSLAADDLEQTLVHFQQLSERLPRNRKIASFAQTLQAGVNPGRSTSAARRRLTQSFNIMFREIMDEAVEAGRCPVCLARGPAQFKRCTGCGYQPPRKRR